MNLNDIDNFFKAKTNDLTIISNNEEETLSFAKYIAQFLVTGDIFVLNGELGAGKTLFTKGLASYYNLENNVSSPTFTIVNEYISNNINIYHFDLYKIKTIAEFENTIGLDYFEQGISIIEWGDVIYNILPKKTIKIDIQKQNETTRVFNFKRSV